MHLISVYIIPEIVSLNLTLVKLFLIFKKFSIIFKFNIHYIITIFIIYFNKLFLIN